MYSTFTLALKYIQYLWRARNGRGHGIHSPFVYQFTREVLSAAKKHPSYAVIEDLRRQLLDDHTVLEIEDAGAGSRTAMYKRRQVGRIAKTSLKPKRFGQLLFRLAAYYKPASILEMGTSLGITTAYLSMARPNAQIITIEGSAAIASMARRNFNWLGLKNVKLEEGLFDAVLPSVFRQMEHPEMVFIDGNHRKQPTLDYVKELLPRMPAESMMILDDIHWSREMEEAWDEIKKMEGVNCTVDLFFLGIIFFRPGFREKQHFEIRF